MADVHPRRIAIACQGGGSHTAFTAGVLKRVLRDEGSDVVALSGTSGGAVCALLAWYGLVSGHGDRGAGLLDAFWSATAANDPWDRALNASVVATSRLEGLVSLPVVSPYWCLPLAEDRFRKVLEGLVPAETLERLVPTEQVAETTPRPLLLVGAVDVLNGEFVVFSSEGPRRHGPDRRRRRREFKHRRLTTDAILASAAVPSLFRAVHVDGAVCWDGLFSRNPPIHDLPDEPSVTPEEIWIVQINPEVREDEPRLPSDIADRRNELSGNLSLYQEVDSIEKMNELIDKGAFKAQETKKYKPVDVRFIRMEPRFARGLDTASKLDRSPEFLRDLMRHGEDQAEAFIAAGALDSSGHRS